MNKKILIIMFFVFLSLLLSGCLYESKSIEIDSISSDNYIPKAIITAPDIAYFGDYIEFDATNSYDSDGNIIFYYWDFGDGDTAEGNKVKHSYKFENDLNINYPLIYTSSLIIMDNKGAANGIIHEIKVYPKNLLLYFQSGKIVLEKPSPSQDNIKASYGLIKLNPSNEVTYENNEPINISICSWSATIYLKKPYLTRLTKIKMVLYDGNDNEISKAEKNLGIFRLWNKKTIKLEGSIKQKSNFYSVKLFINGFSLGKRVNILYGNKQASFICFNFKD